MFKAKIKTKTIQDSLAELLDRNERLMLPAVRAWFDLTFRQLRRDLTTKLIKDVASEFTDWELIESNGLKTIKPATLRIMQTGGNEAYRELAVQGSFSVLNVNAVGAADKICAKLVKDVTAETQAGIRTYIADGIKAGKSMPKIGRELRPLVGITERQTQSVINYRQLLEDKEKFPRLKPADIDRKVQRYADKTHRRRMNDIARTETAHAQNVGYCQGLEENGVAEAELRVAPDACEAHCVPLNTKRYPIGEAQDVIPVHPKCRCAMLPVVDDKAITNLQSETPEGLGPEAPARHKTEEAWEESLTENQLESISDYAEGESQADMLRIQRSILSGKRTVENLSMREKSLLADVTRIESALSTSPGFSGEIYRGMAFDDERVRDWIALRAKLDSGKSFGFRSIQSFTADKGMAARFATWDEPHMERVKVMLHMKKAPRRSAYIAEVGGVPEESEVLIGANAKYKVVSKLDEIVGNVHQIRYEIEEIVLKAKSVLKAELPKEIKTLKRKGKNVGRFSQPIDIETDPKKIKRLKTNLDELIATFVEGQ